MSVGGGGEVGRRGRGEKGGISGGPGEEFLQARGTSNYMVRAGAGRGGSGVSGELWQCRGGQGYVGRTGRDVIECVK